MKSAIGLQIRTASKRLPSKAHLHFLGHPMFGHILRRLGESFGPDEIYVLTSDHQSDDFLAFSAITHYGARVQRGDLDDVRSRYMTLASELSLDYLVRVTGDNPMVLPGLIKRVMEFAQTQDLDYVSNKLGSSFPRGLDLEVFRVEALRQSCNQDRSPDALEHVTPPLIRAVKQRALRGGVISCEVKSLNEMSFTIDTMEDYLDLSSRLTSPTWETSDENLSMKDPDSAFELHVY